MKKKLQFLFATLALWCGAIGANAQAVVDDGVYYLYNTLTEKFLSRGSAYGTAAVVDDYGVPIQVTLSDGVYSLKGVDNNANYGFDTWMYSDADGENVRSYTLAAVEGVEGAYTLTNSGNSMLVYVNTNDGNDKYRVAGNAIKGDNYTEDAATYWVFLTQAQRDQLVDMRNAAKKTAAFTAAGISEDTQTEVGEATKLTFATGSAWEFTLVRNFDSQPATNGNGSEAYQCTGKFTQVVENLEPGLYEVGIQALYRAGRNEAVAANYDKGYNLSVAYLDANGYTAQVKSWAADRVSDSNPNSMDEAAALFAAGKYLSKTWAVVGEDGKLNLTVYVPSYQGYGWFIANNVTYAKVAKTQAPAILANPSFETDGGKTASNAALEITGWTMSNPDNQFNNTELRPANSASTTSQFGTSDPSDGDYSLFYRHGWNGNGVATTFTATTVAEIPAGSYQLSVDYKQHYSHDGNQNSNTKVSIALVNGETTVATATSPAAAGVQGGSGDATYFNTADWSTLTATFTVDEAVAAGAQVVITLNAAGQRRSDFFIDNVQLTKLSASTVLEMAIEAAQAKVAEYDVIGDGIFMYPETEIQPLNDAIAEAQRILEGAVETSVIAAAATTLNAFVADFDPAMTLPAEGQRYSFQLKDGGNYMSIDGTAIKLSASEKPFTLEAVEGGGYAIKGATEYVAHKGGNAWDMSAKADAYPWTITALADGTYRITKVGNSAEGIGVDNTAEGSSCYDNKESSDKSLWKIAESTSYNITVAETENGTVTVDASAIAGDQIVVTVVPEENYSIESFVISYTKPAAQEGEPDEVVNVETTQGTSEAGDITYTFTMPAYDVNISATFTAFYVNIADVEGQGTVTADHTAAQKESSVVLTVKPAENWAINTVGVSYTVPAQQEGDPDEVVNVETTQGTSEAGDITYTFTMPAADVTVAATFRSLGAAYDETLNKWRDAIASITKDDQEFPGQIYDAAVETLMNDADKALVSAQEQLAAGADVKTFDALVATANQKVDEALALAKQNGILPTGEFYFKATNSPGGEIYYLGAGNSWSTQASLIPHSVAWKVSKTKEGAYNLESYVSNGGQSYFFSGTFCDGAATAVAVEAAENGGFYMLVGGKYLGVSGVGADGPVVANNLEAKDGAIIWERVPVAVKYIKQNDDVTYLIKDADFGRNNRYVSAWTVEAEKDAVQMNGSNGNGQTANFVAAADQKVFTVSQALTGLPNGFYNVTVQGIYFDKKALGKDEVDEIPYAFANDEKVELAKQTVADRNEAGNAFREGAFTMTIPVRVTDGNLTIGVKNTKANKWVAFDNFSLVFKGNDATDFVASVATELQALKDKHAAAQTEVQGYDDVWNKAANKNVKTQIQNAIKAVDDAIYKAEVKDNTGKVVTPASGIEVDIQKAGNKLADQKATILAAIKTQSEAVDAYLKIARDLHNGNEDANTKMSADYDKLVAQWQDAFDQINTKWKNEEDEKKAAVYNGYLKELNSIWVDVDALDATIKGFYTAGTSQANKAQTDATIKTLSDDIAAVLKNAYDLYNSEVIAANQASLKEVNDAADALVAKYKAAIEVINSHYASYHTVAAKEAQSRLFDLYNAVRQVQSDALAEYTRINEANAEIAKNTTTFPQFEYFDDNAPTVADFKARIAAIETTAGQDNIAKILEYAETAAIAENTAEYNRILNDVLGDYKNDNTTGELAIEFIAACDLIDMLDAYNAGTEGYTPLAQVYADDIAEIESAFDDLYTYIEKFKTHVKTEVKDSEPTFTCIFAVGRKIDAKVDELQELIDALAAQVEKDLESNKAAMLQIALDEVQETLDEKVANLATYADDIQEAFAGAYDPAAADLAALKAEVEAAVADGTIDEKADEFLARIGDDDDEPVVLYPYETEDGALTDDMFYEWTTSDAIIAEIVGEDADFVSMIGEATNDVVYGDGLVLYNKYANLANYETMIIKFTGAGVPRILINRMEAHGAFIEINSADDLLVDASVDAETGETTWEINLGALKADFADPVNLNVIKAKGGNVTVASIDLVAAKNETIYEKIYGVSVPVENEAAYDEYLADIEDYKEQLETLKDVIDELGAEVDEARLEAIADAIEDADAQGDFSDIVNAMYENIALVPNEDFLDWVVETTITGPMDDIYDDIYRADLADKMLGVKTNWENAFAANKWPKNMDIDADEVWDEIVKFQEALGLNQTNKQDIDYIFYDTDLYDAACERIEEFNLIFTDYEAWIEKFTLKGDMNLDGEITISDVIIATQNALNADDEGNLEGLSKRQAYAADANGDGEYDQSDIVATVNALLAEGDDEEDFAAKARAAEIAEANDVIVVDGKNISLENTTTFFAFTIEAVAADGADVKMTLAERAKGLSILSKKLSNGNTRFVGYSVTNTPIDDTTGILLTANSDVTVTRASFSDALAQTHNLSIFTAEEYATGIDGISEGKNVYEGIYTVGGAKVNTLQKGVNIVRKADGTVKKVYVK